MSKFENKNILIYRLGSLGDTIIALPCFHKIRDTFPNSKITLLTNRPVMSQAASVPTILGDRYFFDQVIYYPIGTRNLKVLFLLITQIRKLHIYTAINLTSVRDSKWQILRDIFFLKASGIKNIIGGDKLFKRPNSISNNENEWEAIRLTRLINSLGSVNLNNEHFWDLKFTQEELIQGENLIPLLGQPFLVISTGTKISTKDWEFKNWSVLLKRLAAILNNKWRLVIIGASEDYQLAEKCLDAWGANNGINLCGKANPRISAIVLKKANLFIGHDSGPMHLAACVGTPVVAIFSAQDIQFKWYPRGKDNNKVIYNKVDCSGCRLTVCTVNKKKCILSITVDEVLEAILDLLSKKSILR